jgi:predicted AAA+ superfamily ATPase
MRRLDDPAQQQLLRADPTLVAEDPKPVLLDEWPRLPEVWDAVRRLVDEDGTGGQFLLTGSMPGRGTHSGAGRIESLRMRPLCLSERLGSPTTVSFAALLDGTAERARGRSPLRLRDYADEIMAGGFPGMRRRSGRALVTQLDGYLQRIVDHDLAEAGLMVRRPATVLGWLRADAAATATTTSWEKIRDAATPGIGNKPARTTTSAYTELLTALPILDPIETWAPSTNHLKRLAAAPKHHLVDLRSPSASSAVPCAIS